MKSEESEKSKVFASAGYIDYEPNAIAVKTLISKTTGNVSLLAFDAGESMAGLYSPFDTLIQVIEGVVEVVIDKNSYAVSAGHFITIPSHSHNRINATKRSKIISTFIKSGYEE